MKDINVGDKVIGIAGATKVVGTVLNIKEGHAYIKAPVSGVYAPIVKAVPLNKVTKLQESHMKASIPERGRNDDDGGMSDYEADHAEQEEKKKKEAEEKKKLEEGLFSKEPKGVEYYRKLRQQGREDNLKKAQEKGMTAPKSTSELPKAKTHAEIEMADSALRKTNRTKGYDPRNTDTAAVSSKYKQMWQRKARYDADREAAGKGPSKVIPTVKKPDAPAAPAKTSLKDKIKGFFKLKESTVRNSNHTHVVTRKGEPVSYHTSRQSAQNKADRLDDKYGATVHSVNPLEEGVFSAVRDFVTGGPKKSATETRKAARAELLARAKNLGIKPGGYSNPLKDETGRKVSRSEADANRALTSQRKIKENAMLMVSGNQPTRVIKRGVKGNGRGNVRTHTGQIANDVAIYKESKDD